MHFTHYAKQLERSIIESSRIDPRIRNYTPSSMASCGEQSAMPINTGQGGWFPGVTALGVPGSSAPYADPGAMGAIVSGILGSIGPSAPGTGGSVRGRGNLPGRPKDSLSKRLLTLRLRHFWGGSG